MHVIEQIKTQVNNLYLVFVITIYTDILPSRVIPINTSDTCIYNLKIYGD